MKTLYLLRHAQAESGGTGGDELRRLTEQGQSDARALGVLMQRKQYLPAYILCSPATRTKQTLEGLCGDMLCPRAEEPAGLYNASGGEIYSMIQQVDDEYDSLLVVAHNPGIHSIAAKLASESSPPSVLNRLYAGYKPGTLTVLECKMDSWAHIPLGGNIVQDVLEPLDYSAATTPARWT